MEGEKSWKRGFALDRGTVTLVGAGLAGSLLATYLVRRGFGVELFERRPDMRKVVVDRGRSINLALSTRGIHALKDVGLYDEIMKIAIPMKGRMIHPVKGELVFQRYGKDDTEVIYATSRANLNIALMNQAERCPGVRITFNRRCTGIDLNSGTLRVHDETMGSESLVPAGTTIGTDGSASALRMEMQRTVRFNLSQSYLDYGYKELEIPPGREAEFRLEKNALHIWPRGSYMLIALPNINGSFTCTFFFPFEGPESFETLDSEPKVDEFFKQQFPDAHAFMPTLLEDFFGNPTGSMVTIKCHPWHVGGKVVLLGDAAHAIVPFFGQGMNCAFEDCTYLDEIIGRVGQESGTVESEREWESIFQEFERVRKVNADAIADLAVENFVEMRDLVAHADFQLKKKVERLLEERYPDMFIPKYSMVTFHRLPYSVALARGKVQDRILAELCDGVVTPEQIDFRKADTLIKQHLAQ
jgi:kynurenine 3-monooxygenase